MPSPVQGDRRYIRAICKLIFPSAPSPSIINQLQAGFALSRYRWATRMLTLPAVAICDYTGWI
jgi:hypothetical protein